MQIITDAEVARQWVYDLRSAGKTIGVVPTMGALHEGHLSLAKLSRQRCSHTIATIFVNPTQFGPGEDLNTYPRTIEQDCKLLRDQSVDAVFVPEAQQMYAAGSSTFVQPPEVSIPLEGEFRPDHFRGVATIVLKLFQILPVTHAFFGRKDYQQLKVIQAMVRDLNVGVEIVAGETVRESDGLALSSRNRYLNENDRQRALLLSRALQAAENAIADGQRDCQTLQDVMRGILLGTPAKSQHSLGSQVAAGDAVDRLDYAVVVNAETLTPIVKMDQSAVALIAAFVGETRLIDNRVLRIPK